MVALALAVWMQDRRAVDLDLKRPPASAETPAAAETTRDVQRYPLRRTADGGFQYEGERFSALIAPDGGVTFVPGRSRLMPGSANRKVETGRGPITSSEQEVVVVESGPGLRFDIAQEYMRQMGEDPLRAEKVAFLTATFDQRMKMAVAARRGLARAAIAELPERLQTLWGEPELTPSEKRHILREMWNGLGQDAAADQARAIIRRFAQRNLPQAQAADFK